MTVATTARSGCPDTNAPTRQRRGRVDMRFRARYALTPKAPSRTCERDTEGQADGSPRASCAPATTGALIEAVVFRARQAGVAPPPRTERASAQHGLSAHAIARHAGPADRISRQEDIIDIAPRSGPYHAEAIA
ncbi:hypothetical protein ABT030_50325 [Streptomyces mirabilis]|uniref:hypothetical protein n=1 Tax=Streptomyces mirabilis TaxID=68239 RepID=UPI003319992F